MDETNSLEGSIKSQIDGYILANIPLGCLRLWYRTMSSGDERCSATFVMSPPVTRFALRIALLLTSVQNTFS